MPIIDEKSILVKNFKQNFLVFLCEIHCYKRFFARITEILKQKNITHDKEKKKCFSKEMTNFCPKVKNTLMSIFENSVKNFSLHGYFLRLKNPFFSLTSMQNLYKKALRTHV